MISRIAIVVLLFPLLLVAQGVGQGAEKEMPKERTFTVTGRVLGVDGEPLAGVHLHVGDPEATTTAEVLAKDAPVTAADGTFSVPWHWKQDVVWSTQSIGIAHKGYASQLHWLQQLAQPKVGSDEPIRMGDIMLVRGQRLIGRVRDAQGQPVVGALVVASDMLGRIFHDNGPGVLRCVARSTAAGIIDFPCALPSGSTITVRADGFYEAQRQPVAAGSSLEFELQPSGFLEGVVECDGKPVPAAKVFVHYELAQEWQEVVADARGAFRCSLRHRGRWRVSVQHVRDDEASFGRSKLGEGPAAGLVVVAKWPPASEQPKMLPVRAVTKGTGAAVRTFQAIAAWGEEASNPWMVNNLRQQVWATKASPDGTVEVQGSDTEGVAGVVYVVAKGHAPLLQKDVTMISDGKALTVELEPEATVAGIVRDAATGKPIAGAVVSMATQSEMEWANGFVVHGNEGDGRNAPPQTAADGSFRIGELGEGDWLLHVEVDGRPPVAPVPVTLKAKEARTGIVVDVPIGATLAGKLVGEPIGAGWRVSLSPVATGQQQDVFVRGGMFLGGSDFGVGMSARGAIGGKPLAADGSFRFEGLALGHYTLLLELPRSPRLGGALYLPIESFRLRAKGLEREFDISGDRAFRIRGRLSFPEATTSMENLVVTVVPSDEGGMFWHHGYGISGGMRAVASRDGTFDIRVTEGSYRLSVYDMALGIVVANGKTFVVKGGDVTQDLAVPLTMVTVEWKATAATMAATMAAIERIELRSVLEADKAMGNAIDTDDNYDQGIGMRLEHGVASLQLALPHGDHCLIARNSAARLRIEHNEPMPSLGKVEFAVPGDGKKVMVLEIGPPPEIGEEAPEGEKKDSESPEAKAGGNGGC